MLLIALVSTFHHKRSRKREEKSKHCLLVPLGQSSAPCILSRLRKFFLDHWAIKATNRSIRVQNVIDSTVRIMYNINQESNIISVFILNNGPLSFTLKKFLRETKLHPNDRFIVSQPTSLKPKGCLSPIQSY